MLTVCGIVPVSAIVPVAAIIVPVFSGGTDRHYRGRPLLYLIHVSLPYKREGSVWIDCFFMVMYFCVIIDKGQGKW